MCEGGESPVNFDIGMGGRRCVSVMLRRLFQIFIDGCLREMNTYSEKFKYKTIAARSRLAYGSMSVCG